MKQYNVNLKGPEWEGLTLEEIRYARVLAQTRIEINREILLMQARQIYSGQASGTSRRTFLGRMFSSFNWLDYGLIALRTGSKIASIWRKRR
jgi:hypothetical protein